MSIQTPFNKSLMGINTIYGDITSNDNINLNGNIVTNNTTITPTNLSTLDTITSITSQLNSKQGTISASTNLTTGTINTTGITSSGAIAITGSANFNINAGTTFIGGPLQINFTPTQSNGANNRWGYTNSYNATVFNPVSGTAYSNMTSFTLPIGTWLIILELTMNNTTASAQTISLINYNLSTNNIGTIIPGVGMNLRMLNTISIPSSDYYIMSSSSVYQTTASTTLYVQMLSTFTGTFQATPKVQVTRIA